jgi:hypothetical protein
MIQEFWSREEDEDQVVSNEARSVLNKAVASAASLKVLLEEMNELSEVYQRINFYST